MAYQSQRAELLKRITHLQNTGHWAQLPNYEDPILLHLICAVADAKPEPACDYSFYLAEKLLWEVLSPGQPFAGKAPKPPAWYAQMSLRVLGVAQSKDLPWVIETSKDEVKASEIAVKKEPKVQVEAPVMSKPRLAPHLRAIEEGKARAAAEAAAAKENAAARENVPIAILHQANQAPVQTNAQAPADPHPSIQQAPPPTYSTVAPSEPSRVRLDTAAVNRLVHAHLAIRPPRPASTQHIIDNVPTINREPFSTDATAFEINQWASAWVRENKSRLKHTAPGENLHKFFKIRDMTYRRMIDNLDLHKLWMMKETLEQHWELLRSELNQDGDDEKEVVGTPKPLLPSPEFTGLPHQSSSRDLVAMQQSQYAMRNEIQ